ncbi:MAG: FxsA family protein [Acetobacterales bacterium]
MAVLLILALLLGVPIIEIALFITVGDWIGLWPTLALVVLTAVAGTALLRRQGLSVLRRLRMTLDRNELPVVEMFDGACVLVAGVCLLTPGFLTDTIGFLLFLAPVRSLIAAGLLRWAVSRADVRVYRSRPGGGPGPGGGPERGPGAGGATGRSPGGPVIEGEYRDVTGKGDRER